VGGKAYHLSRLLNAKIPVPDGYVLSSEFYNSNIDLFKSELALISSEIKSTYVMVRSSAIGEDSTDHSFAGQLESYISKNNEEDLLKNILKCWDSLKNNRAKVYGNHLGKNLETMAVILQEMIEPDYAGVYFTHSPNDYNLITIEWVAGHAEKLVAGSVTPETRTFPHTVTPVDVPYNLKMLREIADKIITLYKRPQDIEWAAKGQNIYIVQTRPITTIKHFQKWSNTNVNENYPDKLSPFLGSLAKKSYYHYFKNLAIDLQVYPKNLEKSNEIEFALNNVIGFWGQRMYYNMTNIHKILELTPFGFLFKKSFDDFVGYQKLTNIENTIKGKLSSFQFFYKLIKKFFFLENKVCYIESMVDSYFEKCQDAFDLKSISQCYGQFLNIRFYEWVNASFADFYAMITHGVLGKVCHLIDPEKSQGYQNELLQAIPNLISNRPIFEMFDIYRVIVADHQMKTAFQEQPSSTIWALLENNKNSAAFTIINKYLKTWGFRCSGELTFLTDNYSDNPHLFIEMLKSYILSNPTDPAIHFTKKHQDQIELIHSIFLKCFRAKGLWKLILPIIIKPLVSMTCYSISSRERVRLKQAKLYYGVKIVLLKLEKILLKKNFLQQEKDIFFLEYEEITRILSGEEFDFKYYNKLIDIRKIQYNLATDHPDHFSTYLGEFSNQTILEISDPDAGFKGLSACGGEITGVVKILEGIHEIAKLEKGDILVTKQTDPGWICAFPLISGLIVERGGMLSHGAIVAREFGIPAIVGVENITKLLKDGQKIHLNAYHGTITCLD